MEEHLSRSLLRKSANDADRFLLSKFRWPALLFLGVFTACSFSASYIRTYLGEPLPGRMSLSSSAH